MRVLLDECLNRRVAVRLTNHHVRTVQQLGWSGTIDGELLRLAQKQFDVFVTNDRNLPAQQHLKKFDIAVIVIPVTSKGLAELDAIALALMAAIPRAKKGHATLMGG